jgi:transcriptional regulator GlxA family with amidase domain
MPKSVSISIFLHKRVSLALALLADFIFNFANRMAARPVFKVIRVHCGPGHAYSAGGISMPAALEAEPGGYLIVPPIDGLNGEFEAYSEETNLIQRAADGGSVIATACLGAFLPAASGLLDGKEATTHWRWGEYAVKRFPEVKWNIRAMLCDEGRIITSGGLLSVVDLALYIIAQNCPKSFVRLLGQSLLADSVRQKQSVYAHSLVLPPKEADRFVRLEQAMQQRLAEPFPVAEMAAVCHMSVRHFHRNFMKNYGVTPNKYLQLKRIEMAKDLLADPDLSIEETAERCGFSDIAFFRTVFGRETGLTPSQYRKRASTE